MKRFLQNHWIFIIIFIAVFALRLFRIETLTSFQGDQGRDLNVIFDMIVNRDPTLLGPPSTFGPFQGPLYYYLLIPGLLFSRLEPIGGLITAVTFNMLGLVALYIFCVSFFNKKIALISSFLFAVSPLNIEIGRTLLNAYFGMPFFITALFVLIYIFVYKKVNYVVLLGFFAGILTQIHYNFAPFFLFCLLLPFWFSHINKKTYFSQFLGMFTLMTLPQILFELRHEFLNTNLLITSLKTGHAMGQFSFSYISFFFSTIGYLLGWENQWYGFFVLLPILATMKFSWKNYSEVQKKILKILSFYTLFFIFLAIASRVKITYPAYHYYMSLMPILFIFVSVFLSSLSYKVVYGILFGVLVVSMYNMNLFRENGFTMVENWNLVKQKEIAKSIATDVLGNKKWNIASVVDGDTQALPFRYLVAVSGYKQRGLLFGKPLRVEEYPATEVLYLVTRDEKEKVYGYTVWEVASLKPFEIKKEWRIFDFNLYRLERI